MYRTFSCCCVILLFAACSGQEQDPMAFKPPVFKEIRQIIVTPFSDTFVLGGAFLMEDIDDFIIIGTYSENKYLHIFKKESLSYVKSFASYGQGPGEMIGPPKIRTNEDKSVLYLLQYYNGKNEYWCYDMENVLYDIRVHPKWIEKIVLFRDEGAQYLGYASDYLAWKDKRLFSGSLMHRLEVQDTLGNTLFLYDDYPKVRMSDTDVFKFTYIHSSLALKPDMSRFVIASYIGCIIEIFSVDAFGKMEKEIEKRFHPPIYEVRNGKFATVSGKTIIGISDISVTDEFIYAAYTGNVYTHEKGGLANIIAVFDWSGNPICQYVLDWKIYRFIVDSNRNRCYLVGIDKNDEVLIGYFDI